jgi:hypothetical protein
MSNPTPAEVHEYQALSEAALMKHRLLMASGALPKPEKRPKRAIAFDVANPELKRAVEEPPPRREGVAKDQSPAQAFLDFTMGLSPQERFEAIRLVEAIAPGCFDETKETEETAQDQPPPFPGRPRPGGEMDPLAEDAAYNEAFPQAARIFVDPYPCGGYDRQQARQMMAMDAAGADSFSDDDWNRLVGGSRRRPIQTV